MTLLVIVIFESFVLRIPPPRSNVPVDRPPVIVSPSIELVPLLNSKTREALLPSIVS